MAIEIFGNLIFSFITSLREILEAALIIGIITSYLSLINRRDLYRDVLYGVLYAILFSISMAWVFLTIFSGLDEYQKLFEGGVMLLAAGVLTWMIIWMSRQAKGLRSEFQYKIDRIISKQEKVGILSLVFFSVAREGAELVLFLYANYVGSVEELGNLASFTSILSGFILGLLIALILAFFIFNTTRRLDTKKFFQITSIILIIFAAGLLAHGLHELYEFFEISGSPFANHFIWTEMWNINDSFIGDLLEFLFGWSYDPLKPNRFEKSAVGGLLVGLFGWNDNPALVEVFAYVIYFPLIFMMIKKIKSPAIQEKDELSPLNV